MTVLYLWHQILFSSPNPPLYLLMILWKCTPQLWSQSSTIPLQIYSRPTLHMYKIHLKLLSLPKMWVILYILFFFASKMIQLQIIYLNVWLHIQKGPNKQSFILTNEIFCYHNFHTIYSEIFLSFYFCRIFILFLY